MATPQDPSNRNADRARSSYDRPHRLTGNFVYEFPFFRDQSGPTGRILGGWQANAFFTLQSGTPFTVLNGADPAGTLQGIDALVGNAIRPNLNTTLDLSGMNLIDIRAAGGASLFSAGAAGQRTGNVGRNTVRGDGIANLDFGIFKNTKIMEGHNLQFRAEFFNATNTRNFGTPNTAINSFVSKTNLDWAGVRCPACETNALFPSYFFLFHSSFFLLPSSFFLLPSSFFILHSSFVLW